MGSQCFLNKIKRLKYFKRPPCCRIFIKNNRLGTSLSNGFIDTVTIKLHLSIIMYIITYRFMKLIIVKLYVLFLLEMYLSVMLNVVMYSNKKYFIHVFTFPN